MSNKVSKKLSIEEAAKLALVCHLYMRKLVKSNKISGTKDSYGRWMIDEDSVKAYIEARTNKESSRIERIQAGEQNHPTRPTVSTYNRMKRTIQQDTELTAEVKVQFLQALERYNEAWNRQYEERQNNK